MSFLIPNTDTYQEALQRCHDLIHQHTTRVQFGTNEIAYITASSLSYLKIHLITPHTVSKLIELHDWTHAASFGSNSKHFFMNKILPPSKKAKKLLIATLATSSLDIGFLFALTNVWWPGDNEEDVPVPCDTQLFTPHASNKALDAYRAAQALVFAPVFHVNKFDQLAHFKSSLPLQASRKVGENSWHIRFHPEHVLGVNGRPAKSKNYVMKIFDTFAQAKADEASCTTAVFGFTLDGEYYLISDAE